MDGKTGAEEQLRKLLSDPQLMNALQERKAVDAPAASEESKA
jgi:hypothetical protein